MTAMTAIENADADGPRMPVEPADLDWAIRWYDASSVGLLVFGLIAAVAACFTAAAAFRQWQANNIIEAHNEWRTASLEKQAADAELALSRSQERIAELEKDTAEANRLAAEAQLELEKLKTPRSISPTHQDELVKLLAPYKGQEYSFNVYGDPEAIALKRQIDGLLQRAGWVKIAPQIGDIVIEDAGSANDVRVQIGIRDSSSQARQELAIKLSAWLTVAGVEAFPAYIAELKSDDAININVGKKP
ncbi:hypothetical protein [Methyloligella solikamskensis]|uniref:Uncharacterized protein n=1 Tax=Methyloligella solikamskensis TaxID=1177756 RepID=A0ABW3J5P5_9HYPH